MAGQVVEPLVITVKMYDVCVCVCVCVCVYVCVCVQVAAVYRWLLCIGNCCVQVTAVDR